MRAASAEFVGQRCAVLDVEIQESDARSLFSERTISAPMPDAPPVTTTRLSFKLG
jgi:hypothetical protein